MILMSYPLINAFARETALALADAGQLAELWTCLPWTPGAPAERWLPTALTRELNRRAWPAPVRPFIHASPVREAARLLAGRVPGAGWMSRHEAGWCSVDAVFQALDRRAARRLPRLLRGPRAVRGVYAYEDGADTLFRAARREGVRCIYDLPIGYWASSTALFAEEAERVPEWAATLTGRFDSDEKRARKTRELAAADAVVVASSFTRRTLASVPGLRARVHVVPYGAPAPPPAVDASVAEAASARPLRVLFAGSLGQRKGLSYLLEAVDRLKGHVDLTLLGAKTVHGCAALDAAVRTHRWIPSLPHAEYLAEMSRQDVLVLPSLFEGFGLVILEGMSRGLPVIATAHTAGPDVIDEGRDGFVVPIRSAEAIAEKLELLRREPDLLAAMRRAARAKAAAFTWENYRRRLLAAVVDDPVPAEGQPSPC